MSGAFIVMGHTQGIISCIHPIISRKQSFIPRMQSGITHA